MRCSGGNGYSRAEAGTRPTGHASTLGPASSTSSRCAAATSDSAGATAPWAAGGAVREGEGRVSSGAARGAQGRERVRGGEEGRDARNCHACWSRFFLSKRYKVRSALRSKLLSSPVRSASVSTLMTSGAPSTSSPAISNARASARSSSPVSSVPTRLSNWAKALSAAEPFLKNQDVAAAVGLERAR